MKLMRLAMCVAVFALVGGIALSEESLDVRALQAKLADQEARLNDLQAKLGPGSSSAYAMGADAGAYGGVPEAIMSRNGNAVVKIGGTINTRYFWRDYDVSRVNEAWRVENWTDALATDNYTYLLNGNSYTGARNDTGAWSANPAAAGALVPNKNTSYGDAYAPAELPVDYADTHGPQWAKHNIRGGDLRISDANVYFDIQVNDYFDAFINLNLQDSQNWVDNAQQAWVRWKNVCNSGFGILVGRSDLRFGMGNPSGSVWTDWTGGGYGFLGDGQDHGIVGLIPTLGWDHSRTTQINPYWESQDGKYRIDLSAFQGVDIPSGNWTWARSATASGFDTKPYNDLGGFSFRVNASPFEGLFLSGSVMTVHNRHANSWDPWDPTNLTPGGTIQLDPEAAGGWYDGIFVKGPFGNKNNTAVDLAAKYKFHGFEIWGQWVRNWNAGWWDSFDTDTFNAGLAYQFNDCFRVYAQGNYLRGSVDADKVAANGYWLGTKKMKGWASDLGVVYTTPFGANLKLGWTHEKLEGKDRRGTKINKVEGDTIYSQLGFDF